MYLVLIHSPFFDGCGQLSACPHHAEEVLAVGDASAGRGWPVQAAAALREVSVVDVLKSAARGGAAHAQGIAVAAVALANVRFAEVQVGLVGVVATASSPCGQSHMRVVAPEQRSHRQHRSLLLLMGQL